MRISGAAEARIIEAIHTISLERLDIMKIMSAARSRAITASRLSMSDLRDGLVGGIAPNIPIIDKAINDRKILSMGPSLGDSGVSNASKNLIKNISGVNVLDEILRNNMLMIIDDM